MSRCARNGELLQASTPDPHVGEVLPALDVDANELALVYRARGMSDRKPRSMPTRLGKHMSATTGQFGFTATDSAEHEAIGTGLRAAVSSFCFFASGALIPVLPYLFGLQRGGRARRCGGASRHRAHRHRCNRGAAVWRASSAAGAAPTSHRIRRRRSHISAGSTAGYGIQLGTPVLSAPPARDF